MSETLISVVTVTYNHEKFIEKCILSVVNQNVDFKIEMIIGEDCSTDKTKEIVQKYEKLYPDIIKPIYYKENLGNSGRDNFVNLIKHCKGKYIAVLDGDDYWLPGKLKVQVAFMENHTDYSLSFHGVNKVYNMSESKDSFYEKEVASNLSLNHLIYSQNYICNSSVMYRADKFDIDLFDELHPSPYVFGDWLCHIIALRNGDKMKFLDETLGMYRVHDKGMSNASISSERRAFINKSWLNIIESCYKLNINSNVVSITEKRHYYNMFKQMKQMKQIGEKEKMLEYLKKSLSVYSPLGITRTISNLNNSFILKTVCSLSKEIDKLIFYTFYNK
mgnify:CR=1 FL=1